MSMQEGYAPDDNPLNSVATETIPSEGEGRLSIDQAARQISGYREKRDEGNRAPRPIEPAATPRQATSPVQEPAQEMPEEAQPEEYSAIDAPASWTAEEKERFKALPPETQAYLTQRETERDTALRRGQNDLATQRQALQQQQSQIDGMRQQYEQMLPALHAQLMQQQQGEFSDIKTWEDAQRLAREDWQRYAMWDAHQKKVAALQGEMQAVQQRHQYEYTQRWNNFAQAEDQKFIAAVPEMANADEAQKVANGALKYLRDIGYSDDDLNKAWSGQANVSLRDHRMQLMIMDAARFREAKAAAVTRKAAPVPKVMRPGSPAERASTVDVDLEAKEKLLEKSGHWKDGADLLIARRNARR